MDRKDFQRRCRLLFEDYLGTETVFCHTPKGLNLLKEYFSDMLTRQTGRPGEGRRRGWKGMMSEGHEMGMVVRRGRKRDGLTAIPLHQKMF